MDRRDTLRMFDDRAEIYAASRPRYPSELYDWIAANCTPRRRAWDVACGNGQASIDLADRFEQIDATDVSAAQIEHAVPHSRVRYAVQAAEETGFPDACFDAVTVAQALHWLDLDRFWPEVARVLRRGGLFVAWGYAWPRLGPPLDGVLRDTLLEPIESYWSPTNRLMWDGYRDVGMPFEPMPAPVLRMAPEWSVDEFYAYAHSWSATRRCIDERGEGFLRDSHDRMREAWGTTRRRVQMSFHVIAGRTDDVTLRNVTAADLPELCAQQQDAEANRLAGVKAREWPEFEKHWGGILADAAVHKKAILFEGRLAGHVLCFDRGGLREIGYWLGRDFRGKRVASRALPRFLTGVPERPLHARVTRPNVASIRVLERCGFEAIDATVILETDDEPEIEEVLLVLD